MIATWTATAKPGDWKVAGTSAPKADERDFVTRSHQHASDVCRPGMVFGKVLRAPAFGAKLKEADAKATEAKTDVTVVLDRDFVGVTVPTTYGAAAAVVFIKANWQSTPQVAGEDLFKHLKETTGRGGGGGGPQGSIGAGLKVAD